MNDKTLKVIELLVIGISEQVDIPTLKNVEKTIGITFEEWLEQPCWRPMIIEADKNSPSLSKAVVLAHAWTFEKGNRVSKELQYALEGIKYFILKTDKAYQQRLTDFKTARDEAGEELKENMIPGIRGWTEKRNLI